MAGTSSIYSYRELFRRGCQRDPLPPRVHSAPAHSTAARGTILHPIGDLPDPIGFYEPLSRLFFDRSGNRLGRVSKREQSRYALCNLVTLREKRLVSGATKTYLIDEEKKRLAYFTDPKDRVILFLDRTKKRVLGFVSGVSENNPAGL